VITRQVETRTAELLIPDPISFEVEFTITVLERYKTSGSDQIPAELIQARGEALVFKTQEIINSIWNTENCPISCMNILLVLFTIRALKLTAEIILGYHCCQPHIGILTRKVHEGGLL
jgi:hypothetical protein